MGNIFNDDFREFVASLNGNEVRYILIGGYSVIIHGYSRTTGDMDIWVERSLENYKRLKVAFFQFGMPVFDMTEDNFLNHSTWDVFTFGRPPSSIDIMVKAKGLDFTECYNDSIIYEEEGLLIRTISYPHLIEAKKAVGRPKDMNDLENLNID